MMSIATGYQQQQNRQHSTMLSKAESAPTGGRQATAGTPGVVDTGVKFATGIIGTGINDTDVKIATGVNDTRGK